jgi:hypothetical protein
VAPNVINSLCGFAAAWKERSMTHVAHTQPPWSTASFGDAADTSPLDLSVLGEHLDSCKQSHGRWFTLQCLAERLNGFFAARFVTTLVAATLLLVGLMSMWS